MKKYLICFLIVFASFGAMAQEGEEDDKKKKKLFEAIMFFAGVNLSSISGESDSYGGSLFGGQAGLSLNVFSISQLLHIRAEPMLSMQGGSYEETGDYYEPNSTKGNVRLNYVNVPVVGRYQVTDAFYAEAGVQPGFLVSARNKHGNNPSVDIKDNVRKVDVGIPFGAGYQFKNRFGVALRVVPGVTNINKSNSTYEANKDRNFTASLRATYTL